RSKHNPGGQGGPEPNRIAAAFVACSVAISTAAGFNPPLAPICPRSVSPVPAQDRQVVIAGQPRADVPMGMVREELLDRRPDAPVSRSLANVSEGPSIVEDEILPGFVAVEGELLLHLLVDVPGVDEQQIRRL